MFFEEKRRSCGLVHSTSMQRPITTNLGVGGSNPSGRATLRFCATSSPIGRKGRTEPPITAAAPASPSTEETMSHQLGARGNDRDQHQLPEYLRCNFIAHMMSNVHAEHDWQHRRRRD